MGSCDTNHSSCKLWNALEAILSFMILLLGMLYLIGKKQVDMLVLEVMTNQREM